MPVGKWGVSTESPAPMRTPGTVHTGGHAHEGFGASPMLGGNGLRDRGNRTMSTPGRQNPTTPMFRRGGADADASTHTNYSNFMMGLGLGATGGAGAGGHTGGAHHEFDAGGGSMSMMVTTPFHTKQGHDHGIPNFGTPATHISPAQTTLDNTMAPFALSPTTSTIPTVGDYDIRGAETEAQRDAREAKEASDGYWVTIFGFPEDYNDGVLRHFRDIGEIVEWHRGERNWMAVRFHRRDDMRLALEKNAKVLPHDRLMVGVVEGRRYMDTLKPYESSPIKDFGHGAGAGGGSVLSPTPGAAGGAGGGGLNGSVLRNAAGAGGYGNTSVSASTPWSATKGAGARPSNASGGAETSLESLHISSGDSAQPTLSTFFRELFRVSDATAPR